MRGGKSNLEECQECSRDDKFQAQANSDYNVDRKYAALIFIILLSLLISLILIYLPSLNYIPKISHRPTKDKSYAPDLLSMDMMQIVNV